MFSLGSIGMSVGAFADAGGWWLRPLADGGDLTRRERWPQDVLATSDGLRAATQVETLLDMEIAEAVDGAVCVRWEQFGAALDADIHLPIRWTSWSPLMLAIDRQSELGRQDFQYHYAFRFGEQDTAVERVGYFVRRTATGQLFHLDEQTFALVDAMDRFNQLPPTERTPDRTWLTFAEVKGCSATVGAALDDYLVQNDVLVPSQIVLDIYAHDEDGSISFVPKADGIPDDEFREAFLRNPDAQGLYVLDGGERRRVRVVLSERQKQVLERMKQVRRARGEAQASARRDPAQFFDGLLDSVTIEYGARVIGIGELEFASMPASPEEGGGFLKGAPDAAPPGDAAEPPARPTAISLPGPVGEDPVRLVFRNEEERVAAHALLADAVARQDAVVMIQGKVVAATEESLEALSQPPVPEPLDSTERARGRRFLLVYTNEEDVRAHDAAAAERAAVASISWLATPTLPQSLRSDAALKPHQTAALLWLQRCASIADRRGVLLADDMGLGKTLQILTFLASRIENGLLVASVGGDPRIPPWRPILIVAPLILVENETWVAEMRRFFAHDGDVFAPVLVLHGAGINAVRASSERTAETVVGRPMLSADKLMQYRTVITNYETVVNFQHSLAQKRDGRPLWSAIVTDEAQKYKAMSTKLSVALKAIDGDFHIASTGTPVENRLLDLWNIMDTIQPALLGNATEFSSTYEHRVGTEDSEVALATLRRRLLFSEPHAFLVRRTKDVLLDLPPKTVRPIECEMSPEERGLHTELLATLATERRTGRHLAVLHKITQLYQHPALLRGDWERRTVSELRSESAKLRGTIEQLHHIRTRGEKVIIFARQLDAQSLLQRVLEDEFRLRVPIINGSTSRGAGYSASSNASGRARNERKRILDDFRQAPGFGIIILSPFVAGIGLTITEANHVVHYGRWWNPAVEAQATDRAYRIGQAKNVTVWLPMLRDLTRSIPETFDECLHALLERKMRLASDFLHPSDDEARNLSELCDRLQTDTPAAAASESGPFTARDLDLLDPHEFEAAVGALYRADGYSVVLTAKGSDGGADVLAFRPNEAVLVQVKHSANRVPMDQGALNDVLAARDIYGSRVKASWRASVASNAPVTPQTMREAARMGIDVMPGDRLLKKMLDRKVGLGATASCAASRCINFEEGVRQARAYAST